MLEIQESIDNWRKSDLALNLHCFSQISRRGNIYFIKSYYL